MYNINYVDLGLGGRDVVLALLQGLGSTRPQALC